MKLPHKSDNLVGLSIFEIFYFEILTYEVLCV